MAEFSFDGRRLKSSSGQKMGELDRNLIRAWNAAKLGEIEGKNIRDAYGKKVLEFDGKAVKDDRGKKITTVEEIQKIIEGEGGIALVAMWHFFVRK
jgi:hypothetical protein